LDKHTSAIVLHWRLRYLELRRRCRYISEDFAGLALHPIDIMDAGTGKLVQQLKDPNLATICPVNKVRPSFSPSL